MLNPHLGQPDLHWQRSRKITRNNAKRFVKQWKNPDTQPEKTSECINLSGDKHFSEGFTIAVGIGNIENVYGIENEHIRIAIFAQLLEEEALQQLCIVKNRKLVSLLNVSDNANFNIGFDLELNGKFHWWNSHERPRKKSSSFIELVITVLDLSFLDALATLANILEMEFASLYQLSSEDSTTEKQIIGRERYEVPALIHIKKGQAGSTVFERKALVETRGNASQVVSATTLYAQNNSLFCIPATVNDHVLSIGRCKAIAYFLNQAQLNAHPYAKVFFCQDMRTALALQHILSETRSYNPAEIIVTAHLGEDLSVVPWSYLYGHDVVFVCAPTKMCMAKVKEYESHVCGGGAKSFKVHLGFLLHSPAGCDLQDEIVGVTSAEAELLRGAVWLDTVERPTWLIAQMAKNAVSYEEYLEWGRNLDIFKIPKRHVHSKTTISSDDLVLFNPEYKDVAKQPMSHTDVTVQHIFPLKRNVLLHGLKDAGKSFISLAITKSVVCGEALFGNFLSDGGSNAMYINSETPKEDFTQRLAQFDLVEIVGQHLFVLSKYDHTATDCPFSLTAEIFRNKVAALLQKYGCRYLILDNLTSLMEDGQSIQTIAVSKIYTWIEKLQQCGICVILVHHTKDDSKAGTGSAKPRGSQDSSIRGHTEIVLISSTQILEQKLGPEIVQLAAAQDGLSVGVLFKVCKSACVLQKKTIWLHLPLGASEWQLLAVTDARGDIVEQQPDSEGSVGKDMSHLSDGQAVNLTANPFPTYCDKGATGIPNRPGMLADCTDYECKLYDYIRDNGNAQNSDVRKILDCEATKAGEALNSLIVKGLIEREGKGPKTHYRLT